MSTVSNNTSEVTKTVTKSALAINLEKGVYEGAYQKEGTKSVELRQEVTTTGHYPSKRATNELNGSLFGAADFGFASQELSNTEKRVGWINVPAHVTLEQVQAAMLAKPEAMLYKVLSNHPILSSDQNYAISTGLSSKTLADYSNSQIVRYPASSPLAGQIVLNNGKVQYRATFFSDVAHADTLDKRTADPADFFASDEIKAELAGTSSNFLSGQGLNN